MSAFDVTVRVGELSVEAITHEDGKTVEAHILLGVISILPMGDGRFAPIPFGTVRAPVGKAAVGSLIKELQEVYERLEEPSRIETATDLSEAERIAKVTQGLT